MISIDIQPYCDDCPAFKAAIDGPTKLYSEDDVVMTNTVIRCEKRHICAGLVKYLKKELLKGEKE